MKRIFFFSALFFSALGVLLLAAPFSVAAKTQDAKKRPAPWSPPAASPRLQKIVDDAARAALERFKEKGLTEKNLAVTLVDLTDPLRAEQASFRGAEPIYPASVVKLFYLSAAHRWMENGRLKETEEVDRALKDMIVESLNDPAHNFTGLALGPGARLWSKAGWTDTARHDAAYIELADGHRIVLVTFTTGVAKERDIIPSIARAIIKAVAEKP